MWTGTRRDLATGGGGPEFALAAVVVGADLGMIEEGEEVLAQPAALVQRGSWVRVG